MPSAQKQRIRHIKGFKFFAPLSFKKADGVRGGAPEEGVRGGTSGKGCGVEPRKKGLTRHPVKFSRNKFIAFVFKTQIKKGNIFIKQVKENFIPLPYIH